MIVSLIITIALVGFLLWAINTYVPMQPEFKQVMNVGAILLLVLWFISKAGIVGY